MDLFYALAASTRRTIIEMLARRGELTATDIARQFNASPPAISQHLKVLRETKLVAMRKNGQQRLYQLNTASVRTLERWAKQMTKRRSTKRKNKQ